ncbi:hypothetical protein DFQ26_006879 [Actinomortierella ambigua]|nr:hypothetical protein DFQ26_006879 [Actinomortierella ambigua]
MARALYPRQQLEGSNTSTTVLSVSIMNPYHRDLLALQQDFAQNQAQLKLTQQTLQQTYHDLMLAQEQKRKAESDAIQLRLQWDNVVKKHLDHLPERQLLVQQVAELKEELERERQFRTTLQNERGAYIQEILKLKADVHSLKATANTTSSSSPSIFAAPPTRRSSSSSNSGGGGVVGFFFSRQSTSSSLSHPPAARAPASPPSSSLVSSSPPPPPVRIIQPTKHAQSSPHHPSPPAAPSSALSPTASLDSSHYSGSNNPWSSDGSRTSFSASSASHDESLEFLEAEKAYYEQLRQENAALVITVQELKDKQGREQESKQANALALAQADLDLLRADQAASQARLEARSSLVHAFAATVNAQATEIERLTADRGRHQVARAQVEQELAVLIDASLSTLQRLIGHLQTGYRQIVETALEPMRQTIHHLASLPPTNASADTDTDTDKDTDIDTDAATAIVALCRDWESCELAVEQCWHALELSLVQMQQAQELGLAQKSRGTSSSSISSTSSSFSLISPPPRSSLSSERRFSSTLQRGAKPPSIITDMGGAVGSVAVSASAAAVATATAAMTDLEVPSTSSTLYSSSSSSSTSSSSQCQNGTSRQDAVIMERKTMADTYLEDCVVSVEQLARDKRILQQLVLDLRKEKAAKDEEALVRKLMSLEDGAQQACEQQEEHEQEEQVAPQQQQQQQVTSKAAEEQDNSVEDEKEGREIEIEVDVDVDGRDNIEEDSDSSATPAAPCEDGAPTIESDHSNSCQGAVTLCQPEQQNRSAAQEESDHVREARARIARLENLLATVLAWIESIDSSDPAKFSWYYHRHRQQSHLDETVSELSEEGILALDVLEALPALSSRSLGGSPCKDTVLQPPVPNDGTQPSDSSMAITEARTSTPLQIMTMIRQELVANHHRHAVASVTTDGTCPQVTKFPEMAQNDESKGGPVDLGRQTSFTATTNEPNRQHHKESLVSSSSSPQMQQQQQQQHLQSEAWGGRIEGQETCVATRSRSGSHGLLPRFLSFARTTDKCYDVDIDSDLEEAEEAEAEESEDEDDDDDHHHQKVARIRQHHHHRKKVSLVAEVQQTPSLPFGASASDREHQTPPPPPLSSPPSSSPTSSPTPSLPLSPKRPPYLLEKHHHDRRSIHTNIALLAPSFSPAPGIGSGGQQVDVEAFCRDLAFRSFPKLHQWSKAQRAQKRSVGFVGSGSK